MNNGDKLDKEKAWLAAEYALGVSEGDARRKAENLVARDASFRKSVYAWQNQLSPLLNDVEEVQAPSGLWKNIEAAIAPSSLNQSSEKPAVGIWKFLTGLMSAVALGCLSGLLYISGGDFSSGTVSDLKQRLNASNSNVESANSAFELANQRFEGLKQELERANEKFQLVRTELDSARKNAEEKDQQLVEANSSLQEANANLTAAHQEVANVKSQIESLQQEFDEARPLVASLTQSGDLPAFVAQYNPITQALLIRTRIEDNDEKVPEIWLIPAQGERKGEVLSLGVMDENAPDEVKITDDFVKLIGEGGTLAITMEPPGGSPTGIATGAIIALGKLQAF